MREKGAVPCTYTADLGQYDEDDIATVPGRGRCSTAPSSPRLVDCREALVEEGLVRADVRRLPHPLGRVARTSTPRRSAAPSPAPCSCARCARTTSTIWGDGSTFKGNDIERFYRYGLLANPNLRIYKPWLDPDFVTSSAAAHEMSAWLTERDLPYRPEPGEGVLDRRQHLGRHPRGQDASSTSTSRSSSSSRSWACGSGTRPSRSPPRTSRSTFERGPPRGGQRPGVRRRRSTSCTRRTSIGGRHGLGMSDQIENRIIEAKSRGIYEAPGMALLFIAYERLAQRDPQRGHRRELPRTRAAASAGCSTRAAGSTRRRSCCARALQRWVAGAVTGEVTLRLRRGEDYSIVDTSGPHLSYHPDRLSMERTEDAAFGPLDRIGQLTMRNLDIADSRQKLELYAAQGQLARPGRAHRPPRAGRRRPRSPSAPTTGRGRRGRASLDRAAMEFGAD